MIQAQNFVGGTWKSGSGEKILIYNPATREPVSEANSSSEQDVQEAVVKAGAAFELWRKKPAPLRGEYLYQIGMLLKERKQRIARLISLEVGKTKVEAEGEVQEAIDMAFYMAGEGRRMFGHTIPSELPDKWTMSAREPVGIIGAISAFNFPVAVPSWKIIPSIILGNTVVWKPSPETPATATEFTRCFEDAGLPPGVFNLILGDAQPGQFLVEEPRVAHISFTGSTETGKAVYESAAKQLKRVSLELGGKNAIIVLKDANLELAAEGIVWAAFGTSGQRCTAASRVIIEEGIYDQLLQRILQITSQLNIGDVRDENVDVGPLINENSIEKVEAYIKRAVEENIKVHCGGKRLEGLPGHFFAPTVLGPVAPTSPLAKEEIFGPVLCLIKAQGLDEAIKINNSVSYGLSTAVFTRNVNHAFTGIKGIDTGIVYVNHGTTGAEIQLPFGGTKDTGNGMREAGQAALDAFSEWKTIYIDYSDKLQRAQIDTDLL
jgi:aldehyde dehydrogenase (NAD+)